MSAGRDYAKIKDWRDRARRQLIEEADRLLADANSPSPAVESWTVAAQTYLDAWEPDGTGQAFGEVRHLSNRFFPFAAQWRERQRYVLEGGRRLLRGLDAVPIRVTMPETSMKVPEVFIAHSGQTSALQRLQNFIRSCGFVPRIAEQEAYRGRLVPEHVRLTMDRCAMAILFAEAVNEAEGKTMPGVGVLTEAGILQERFQQRVVYFIEEGVDAGPMVDTFLYTRFTPECLEEVFERLVIEFRAHGLWREAEER